MGAGITKGYATRCHTVTHSLFLIDIEEIIDSVDRKLFS